MSFRGQFFIIVTNLDWRKLFRVDPRLRLTDLRSPYINAPSGIVSE